MVFVGGRDAAINTLQKKLAEVDSQRKKELEMRERIEAELKSLQDKVCLSLVCDIATNKEPIFLKVDGTEDAMKFYIIMGSFLPKIFFVGWQWNE